MASQTIGGRSYGRSLNYRSAGSQDPISPARSPTHVANSQPSVHMEDSYVVRTSLPMLHHSRTNGSKWYWFFFQLPTELSQIYNLLLILSQWNRFKHNTEVSTAIRKIIQGCFKGPWYSWKKVSPYYKRTWFSMFKVCFITNAIMVLYLTNHLCYNIFSEKVQLGCFD